MKNIHINFGEVLRDYQICHISHLSDGTEFIENVRPLVRPSMRYLYFEPEIGDRLILDGTAAPITYSPVCRGVVTGTCIPSYTTDERHVEVEVTHVYNGVVFFKYIGHPDWREDYFDSQRMLGPNLVLPKELDVSRIMEANIVDWDTVGGMVHVFNRKDTDGGE